MIVDTHCHLHFDAYDADRDEVIRRAKEFGIGHMVSVGTDPATNQAAFELTKRYDCLSHTVGLHPHHAQEVSDTDLESLRVFVQEHPPVAIGEIGLDYFKSQADEKSQKRIFAHMLHLAMECGLPVIVHSRNAFQDTLDTLQSETDARLRGVMHCFSYDRTSLSKVLDKGLLVSFTCNLTFKNAGQLLEVAKAAPLDRIMLETDAPYLAPQIYRGKRNEPACLAHLAAFLAECRGISQQELEAATTATAASFFKLNLS